MTMMNKAWRQPRTLTALAGVMFCASAFAAEPAPPPTDAAVAVIATPEAETAPVAAPEPAQQSAQDATPENAAAPVRFLVMANQESPLSSVVAGRVLKVNVELGDTVKAGKSLVTLDCSELKARRDAAEAEYNAAQIKYEAKAKLQGLNSAGALEVGLAAADVNRTRSQIKIYEAQLTQCRFTAPFDGRVARIYVKEGQGIGAGAQVIDLVSNGTRKARLNVPSSWISWLAPGVQLDAVVGETGKHYLLTVTHVSGRVDAVSQTIEIESAFAEEAQDVLPGMSGRATPVCTAAATSCPGVTPP